MFSKGKNNFSNDTYKIADKTGYKISVVNDDNNKLYRKFKPSELLKINKVDKPMPKIIYWGRKRRQKERKNN